MAEVVAGILRERIIDGELTDGDLLPKQDELLEEFRISRPSMREALRILEDEGLLTVRRGNQGGSVIEVPTAETSAYTFGLVLQSRRGSIADLAQAIRHIEPITAALCAKRDDREETVLPVLRASLDETADAIGDGERFTALARAFHERLVGCCGNETMILTVGALETLWSEQERQWAQAGDLRRHVSGRELSQSRAVGTPGAGGRDPQGPGREGEPARRSASRPVAALFAQRLRGQGGASYLATRGNPAVATGSSSKPAMRVRSRSSAQYDRLWRPSICSASVSRLPPSSREGRSPPGPRTTHAG